MLYDDFTLFLSAVADRDYQVPIRNCVRHLRTAIARGYVISNSPKLKRSEEETERPVVITARGRGWLSDRLGESL